MESTLLLGVGRSFPETVGAKGATPKSSTVRLARAWSIDSCNSSTKRSERKKINKSDQNLNSEDNIKKEDVSLIKSLKNIYKILSKETEHNTDISSFVKTFLVSE